MAKLGSCMFMACGIVAAASCAGLAQPNLQYATVSDPFLFLLREPAVLEDLDLTASQRRSLSSLNARFDEPLLALRNWPAEKANAKVSEIVAESTRATEQLFNPSQQRRLSQIQLRVRGVRCLQLDAVAEHLQLTADQRRDVERIVVATLQEIGKLHEQAHDGGNRESAEQEQRRLQQTRHKHILALLTQEQMARLTALLGPPFDAARLGRASFKAPELIDSAGWINSPPLRIANLRGHVVALHFWTFGCINCIRNYPCYRGWQDSFSKRGLTIIGIHTPEGESERSVESVQARVKESEFTFPVLIDNDRKNWTAWGNGIWPSVYLIDQRGYLRYWWYGELNWQGTEGEHIMRQHIEGLLAERN